jgi:hypothetical protein
LEGLRQIWRARNSEKAQPRERRSCLTFHIEKEEEEEEEVFLLLLLLLLLLARDPTSRVVILPHFLHRMCSVSHELEVGVQ